MINILILGTLIQGSLQEGEALGPSLVTGRPQYYADASARARFDYQNGVLSFDIKETGPKPWGVQIFWPQHRRLSGKKYRLSFGAKSDCGATFVVKCQQLESPYQLLGLEQVVQTGDEWKQYTFDFEVPPFTRQLAAPLFYLSSNPGIIALRGVSLKVLPKPVGAAPALSSEADIFGWYDKYIERFRAGDLNPIMAAWSPDFVDLLPSAADPKQRSRDMKWWTDHLEGQSSWKGKFSNGPVYLWVSRLSLTGATATVDGFRAGSWRSVDEKGDLIEGGYSFSGDFRDQWKKTGQQWKLVKSTSGDFREADEAERTKLGRVHAELKKRLKL